MRRLPARKLLHAEQFLSETVSPRHVQQSCQRVSEHDLRRMPQGPLLQLRCWVHHADCLQSRHLQRRARRKRVCDMSNWEHLFRGVLCASSVPNGCILSTRRHVAKHLWPMHLQLF
jgi:hypothetical protein